ncbi:hypothetical protein HGRIS_002414 [Hohenbuehelia grisea]|uniref:Peroxisomal ATPase PEX1 n=1 Tax=Hohenbuehelia grisea TaxID=104357 RepID=A0ABR3JMB3_9AGAR
MPRRARIHFSSIRSSLVNLPISIYGPLLERNIRPQNLAIHLTLVSQRQHNEQTKVEAYVGWTGMASASSLAHFNASESGERGLETIEIDPQYAQGLGFMQGDMVEIGLLHDLATAVSVATEPLTSDDWEIIELHASHVEATLLSQVRVAKTNQEINVWVLGRTRVRLRVISLDPSSKDNALLLTTNTEVSIAPKLHASQRPTLPTKGHALPEGNGMAQPATSSGGASASEPAKMSSVVVRTLPGHLFDRKYAPQEAGAVVGYVSRLTLTQVLSQKSTSSGVEDDIPLEDAGIAYKASFKRLEPPVDPNASSNSASIPVTPSSRILNPINATSKDTSSAEPRTEDPQVFLTYAQDVPDSHIVFDSLPEGLDIWDLVRLSQAGDKATRTLTTNAQESQNLQLPLKPIFMAGVDEILRKSTRYCETKLVAHSLAPFVHGVSALLITGRSGAGKTSIAHSVSQSLQRNRKTLSYVQYVDLAKYSEKPVPFVKSLFRYSFEKAAWHKPSILIFDNMDKLLSVELEHADSFRSRHLAEVFLYQYSAACRAAANNFRGVIMLGTASSAASLHPLINKMHVFEEEVHVKPPDKNARRDILSQITHDRFLDAPHLQPDTQHSLNFTALATLTEGYSATDLQDLTARAVHQHLMRSNAVSTVAGLAVEDFEAAQIGFTPISLRDVKLQKSDIVWTDVGGLRETKKMLRETLEWPTKYGSIFAQSPLRLRSGILLYGYPGCGKTLLASAVARECGLNFISVKGPEILNKYIGASEKSVRELFERASAAKPCVLFFDEFDSIAPKRGHDSTGVTDRVVNQMLTQMDGAEGLEGVYVLAATSRPDLIDSALLRPGRLDKSLLCGMPDVEERKDILEAVARKVRISEDVDLAEVAAVTEGFSGADLQALLYNAHLEVIHASIAALPVADVPSNREEKPIPYVIAGGPHNAATTSRATEMALQRRLRQIKSSSIASKSPEQSSLSMPPKHREITPVHIDAVLKTARPSVSLIEQRRLKIIYDDFVGDRSGGLPVPPDGVGIGNRVSLM